MHDERLLAADGVPWQSLIGEPDPVELMKDGYVTRSDTTPPSPTTAETSDLRVSNGGVGMGVSIVTRSAAWAARSAAVQTEAAPTKVLDQPKGPRTLTPPSTTSPWPVTYDASSEAR